MSKKHTVEQAQLFDEITLSLEHAIVVTGLISTLASVSDVSNFETAAATSLVEDKLRSVSDNLSRLWGVGK